MARFKVFPPQDLHLYILHTCKWWADQSCLSLWVLAPRHDAALPRSKDHDTPYIWRKRTKRINHFFFSFLSLSNSRYFTPFSILFAILTPFPLRSSSKRSYEIRSLEHAPSRPCYCGGCNNAWSVTSPDGRAFRR